VKKRLFEENYEEKEEGLKRPKIEDHAVEIQIKLNQIKA